MGQLAKCHQGSGDDDGNKYAKRRVEVDSPTVLSRMMPKFANTLLIKTSVMIFIFDDLIFTKLIVIISGIIYHMVDNSFKFSFL